MELTAALTQALNAYSIALDVPNIDSYVGLMHTLFTLKYLYGLTAGATTIRNTILQQRWMEVSSQELSDTLKGENK